MRTVIGVALAVGITLFCLSVLRAGVLALEAPVHVFHGLWYNAQGLFMAPGHALPGMSFLASFLVTALVVALVVGWIRHRERDTAGSNVPRPDPSDDLGLIARDLDRTARRLEERIEALETILLDRGRTPC